MPILTPEERLGTLLGGKYRLEKIVGRGGMGTIFQGRHEWTARPVAVKILHREHVDNTEAAERFLREARTAASLKHAHVVDVLDMGDDAGTVYMVLELLEGDPLSKLLTRDKTFPVARAAELLLPVMRAVAHAHSRNVVHRDLKPENIFIHRESDGREVPKILDFGIATALDGTGDLRMTQTGFIMGTPAYMSPEQGAGIPDRIGAPADVWSMGVIWYEALSGDLPFEGPTTTATLLAVAAGKYNRLTRKLPSLPVSLASAIDKALVRDATRRYTDMGAFADAIQKALAGATDSSPVGVASAPSHNAAPTMAARGTAPPADTSDASPWVFDTPTPELTTSPPETIEGHVIELGPMHRPRSIPVTMGVDDDEPTDEPVVLLDRSRRKSSEPPPIRRRSALPFAAAIVALVGIVAMTFALARRPRGETPRPQPATHAPPAPPPSRPPAMEPQAPPGPNVATPGAPVDGADVPAVPPRRRRSRGRDDPDDDLTRPLRIYIDPPRAIPVTQPVAPSPAPTTPAVAPGPAVRPASAPTTSNDVPARPTPTSVPRENAPMTDYERSP